MVRYAPQTCQAVLDEQGNIVVDPGVDSDGNVVPPGEIVFVAWVRSGATGSGLNPRDNGMVWRPGTGSVDGGGMGRKGEFMRRSAAGPFSGAWLC